jgi:hypothetical protein
VGHAPNRDDAVALTPTVSNLALSIAGFTLPVANLPIKPTSACN